jgi:hypothetical protein
MSDLSDPEYIAKFIKASGVANPVRIEFYQGAYYEATDEFYRFNCPKLGYSILLVPHSEKDRAKLLRKSKESDLSLSEFARDEIVGVMILGKFPE